MQNSSCRATFHRQLTACTDFHEGGRVAGQQSENDNNNEFNTSCQDEKFDINAIDCDSGGIAANTNNAEEVISGGNSNS